MVLGFPIERPKSFQESQELQVDYDSLYFPPQEMQGAQQGWFKGKMTWDDHGTIMDVEPSEHLDVATMSVSYQLTWLMVGGVAISLEIILRYWDISPLMSHWANSVGHIF